MRKEIILKDGVKCIVRNACSRDAANMIDYVNKINHETENLTMEPGEFNLTVEQEKAIIKEYEDETNALFLIAEIENKIVGATSVKGGRRKRTKHLASMGISVLKEYWYIGVGSALMESIIDWAKTAGISKINLEVRVDNKNAIKLYEKYGFVNSGINTRGLKIRDKYVDLYMMGLEIN